MTHTQRSFLTLLLASSLAAPASAVCTPTLSSVDNISIILMTADPEETNRREFAEISDDLASALGIVAGDIDADPEAPNPQIRVRVQSSPVNSGIADNNAVFTVTAINTVTGTDKLIWIYEEDFGGDKDSGEFKVFATSTGTLFGHTDNNNDDLVDDVTLRAFTIPVSTTTFTDSGGTVTTEHFCEPSTSKNYIEIATREADDQVVVLAPHGGNIETGTSLQVTRFATELESINSTPVNVWNIEGKWGNNQTFERWHITSTSIDPASYPGLADLLPVGGTFDYAVSFHGFGGSTSTQACSSGPHSPTPRLLYQIILGGGAPRNLKCAIALAIDDEMVAATRTDDIAIAIRDDVEGNINIADTCGRNVSQSGLSGTHEDNIVNRLASVGGIQLEQSKTVRDDATLRNLVADGVAEGLADYMADDTVDYCNGL